MISSRTDNSIYSTLKRYIAGRIFPVCILFIIALSVTSCDFFRKLAGRPTAAQLATLQWRKDSLERAAKANVSAADTILVSSASVSTAAPSAASASAAPAPASSAVATSAAPAVATDVTTLKASLSAAIPGTIIHSLSRYGGLSAESGMKVSTLPRYSIIVGTFKNADNAARYTLTMKKKGFTSAQSLHLKGAYTLVMVASVESVQEVLSVFGDFSGRLPKDAWVLLNDLR
jgi:hypothetical protein